MFKVLTIFNKIHLIQLQKYHIHLLFQVNILQDQTIQLRMEKSTQIKIKVVINQQINHLDTKNIQYQAQQLIIRIRQLHQNMAIIQVVYLMGQLIIKIIIKILTLLNKNNSILIM